jgi:hypothetical protein
LRHPYQATARERIERPLAEPAEESDGSAAPGDNDLASPLHALQVLTEAIMQLTDADFALMLM